MLKKHNKCLICNSAKLKKIEPYYSKNGLVKCSSCSFVFMEKIPTKEELDAFYGKYAYLSENYYSPLTKKVFNELLDDFEKYRSTGKILDVGCGRGWFLIEAKNRGWEVFGTEYSDAAIDSCESSGICMEKGGLSTANFTKNSFDIITSFEVLEHINNPVEEITLIHGFLRQGGLFYFTTPNWNSLLRFYLKDKYNIINYPEHLSYFSRSSINNLMIKNGFRLHRFLVTGISISRFKTSKNPSSELLISNQSSDERLRQNIDKRWILHIGKKIANKLLTLFGVGMSLKGYYIKK